MAKSSVYDLVSLEEYLRKEEEAVEKHELWHGQVYAMAGGSSNHGEIILALHGMCRNALKGRTCRTLNNSLKVVVEEVGSGYYPDGAIACPPNYLDRKRGTYDNPTVVFEVISPSTWRLDRTRKFDDYKKLPSVQDYILIESQVARVEVYSRLADGSWALRVYLAHTSAHIPSVGIDLSLDELYENAAFEEELASGDEAV